MTSEAWRLNHWKPEGTTDLVGGLLQNKSFQWIERCLMARERERERLTKPVFMEASPSRFFSEGKLSSTSNNPYYLQKLQLKSISLSDDGN